MAIASVSSVLPSTTTSQSGKTAAAASASASLNYNDFLQLLIAQMQTQDPTAPMDATQQISQLASFSQVEQQIQTNSHLEASLQNQMISQAASFVGKQISSSDGTSVGTVKEVSVYSDGIVATTTNGTKVQIQPGITVADAGTQIDVTTDAPDSDSGK